MYKSTTHIQRSSTRQALRAARLAPSLVVFSFLCLALTLAPRAASAFRSYGPPVDSYCLNYDGSTPYQDSGCLLCHTSNSGSGEKPGTWNWYNNSTYQYFCTGAPPNRAPNGSITAPLTNQQIAAGSTVRFEGTGTDADGDTLTYSWNLGVTTATGPGPHLVSFPNAGSYVVTLTVSDGQLSDPTPATRQITVNAATSCTDDDGDGYLVGGAGCAPIDCDDNDPAINPGAIEDCSDGIDNNCNGLIDTADSLAIGCIGCLDSDGDLFSPEGGSCGPIDCDDTDATVNPGAVELCSDGIDNDCDFYLDGTDAECSGEDCIGELLAPPGIGLLIGEGPARDDPQPLEGLTVRGSIFVFLDARPEIVQVSWSLDNDPVGISTEAPWDFAGSTSGTGNPFNTRTLANGWHSMFAEILLDSGQTQGFSAAFIVDNQGPNQAPTCTIDQPTQAQTIMVGDSLSFAGTGIETDGDLPLSFVWDFDGAASNQTVADPGSVRFDRAGSYTLSFTVTDSAGLPCAPPATLSLTVRTANNGGDDDDDDDDDDDGDRDDNDDGDRDDDDGDRDDDDDGDRDDDDDGDRDDDDGDRDDDDGDRDDDDDGDRDDQAKTLTKLAIAGPNKVDEAGSASYIATATYSDNSNAGVVPTWSENSNYASVNTNGELSASAVTTDQTVTLSASYSEGGVTEETEMTVTILDVPGPTEPVVVFADSFEDGQWNGKWSEDSQNDWQTSTERATDGRHSAEVDGRARDASLVSVPIDLQGATSATIEFDWYIEERLDRGEYLAFDLSVDGGDSWQQRARLDGDVDAENQWHEERIELTGLAADASLLLRFFGSMSGSQEDADVDAVRVTAPAQSTQK